MALDTILRLRAHSQMAVWEWPRRMGIDGILSAWVWIQRQIGGSEVEDP
jgi:hypothetical protein